MEVQTRQSQQKLQLEDVLQQRAKQFGLRQYRNISEKVLLQEAKLAGPFQYSRMVYTLKLNGPLPYKQQTVQKRIKDFFIQHAGVNLQSNMQPRNQPNYFKQKILIDTLHIYGVDYMSTRRLMRYLGIFQPYKLQWVNQSACNAIYDSPMRARKAMIHNIRYPSQLPHDQPQQIVIDQQHQPYIQNRLIQDNLWYQLKPYFQLGFQRKLFCRFATDADVRNPFGKESLLFSEYLIAKRYFVRNRDSMTQQQRYQHRRWQCKQPLRYRKKRFNKQDQ